MSIPPISLVKAPVRDHIAVAEDFEAEDPSSSMDRAEVTNPVESQFPVLAVLVAEVVCLRGSRTDRIVAAVVEVILDRVMLWKSSAIIVRKLDTMLDRVPNKQVRRGRISEVPRQHPEH